VESGLEVDGKINFKVVTKMLTDNSENPEKWKPAIEKSVKECMKADNFQSCINTSLMNNCVDWKEKSFCAAVIGQNDFSLSPAVRFLS
jgi:hypothetical protein